MKYIVQIIVFILAFPFLILTMPIDMLLTDIQKTKILERYEAVTWDEHDSIYFVCDPFTRIMYSIDFSYFTCKIRRFEDTNSTGCYLHKKNSKDEFVKYTKKEMNSNTIKNRLCFRCYVYDKAA